MGSGPFWVLSMAVFHYGLLLWMFRLENLLLFSLFISLVFLKHVAHHVIFHQWLVILDTSHSHSAVFFSLSLSPIFIVFFTNSRYSYIHCCYAHFNSISVSFFTLLCWALCAINSNSKATVLRCSFFGVFFNFMLL